MTIGIVYIASIWDISCIKHYSNLKLLCCTSMHILDQQNHVGINHPPREDDPLLPLIQYDNKPNKH